MATAAPTPITERSAHLPFPASDMLRFSTAGSVDDGKSTLIGRLLHDSKSIFEDQLASIELASRRRGRAAVDLALLTDGLRAEREQGITIDVAYRYFATPRRKFIIADTPGHVQYTRNMVTGSSTADLSIVLVDARNGVVEQTRRHMLIAAMLRVPHVVAAVNKMDLVERDEGVFAALRAELETYAADLGIAELTTIPISALEGDNVVERSARTPWYDGPSLLEHLEEVEVGASHELDRLRFPVQWVIRAAADDPDYRAYAGRLEAGIVRPGDTVMALPSGVVTTIASIDTFDGQLDEAYAPQSVAIRLTDDLDLGRGGMLVRPDDAPPLTTEVEGIVCWLGDLPIRPGGRYWLTHTTRTVRAIVDTVIERIDVETLGRERGAVLGPNDIGRVRFRLAEPIAADPYESIRATGSAILIDEATNATVGAILITAPGDRWLGD